MNPGCTRRRLLAHVPRAAELFLVQPGEGVSGGVELPAGLGHGPVAGRPVDREHGPPIAVLPAEVHEERLAVVLHASAVSGVALLVQDARLRA